MDAASAGQALGALLDDAPCGFLTFRDDGSVLLANRTLLDLLGYQREEVVGRHFENLLSVGARIFYQTHLFPLARLHGRADEIFLVLRSRDGQDVGVFVNVRRRDEGGTAVYDVALMQVRERAKYEQELLHARRVADEARNAAEEARLLVEEQSAELEATAEELEATNEELAATNEELAATNEELIAQTGELERLRQVAEAANRAKTDFLAVMSHELRTPLNAISGYVQILELGIQGPLTNEQRDTLARVDRAQQRLLRLINDLLNLSKVEAGGIDFTIEELALEEEARSVVMLIEPQSLEKHISVHIDVPAALHALGDREKVEQILINLLSNAIKFTPEGGEIVIAAAPDQPSGFVGIAVTDSGIGIPEDKLDDVFVPFFQVESGHKSQGTGLGLAISREFARGMGGDLVVSSRIGAGSTFTLVLPIASTRFAPRSGPSRDPSG